MWVIIEGISFVQGLDDHDSALIMTPLLYEAKFFASPQQARHWVLKYGRDLESHRILHIEEAVKQSRRVLDP
jgi:hypothetical protein